METDYTNMSCTTSGGNSIEHIHNSVHNAVGGYGHLTDSAASAFDPIFWLHHTNVDRLFAIWQAINPQSYIVPVVNPFGTYAQPRGFLESGDSNLLPFRVDNGTSFWTSNAVRSTRKFGYTYPELVDWNISEAALASEARASVNKLYNSGSANGTNYQRRRLKAETGKIGRLQPGGFTEAKEFGRNDFERQWTITVKIQRFAYPDPFAIDFFVGSPPVNPLAWPTASNLVGSFAQFIAANSEIVEVKASSQTLNHGEVSLTRYLVSAVQKGSLATLEPDSVIPFLTKSLHWRARDMKGRELQLESLAALSIAVGSQAVQPVKVFNQFPVYKELEIYGNITAGKPGGYGTRRTLRYWLR